MCGGPEQAKSSSTVESKTNTRAMNNLTIETEDTFSSLLELAANNDVDGFKRAIERDASSIDEAELWYCRKKNSKNIVLEQRTPLMVASTYGSLDILKLILSLSEANVNRSCGPDKSTALHCAASGGSMNAIDVVKLLLSSGADPNSVDVMGQRPADVIVVSPKNHNSKVYLLELLTSNITSFVNSNSSTLSSSPENGSPGGSPMGYISEKKEYPIDPSLPDIKNSIYSTDEFRMFSFKVRPCSRAYSHDWTECPFVHPGENARRRDPRKFHYSCVPCPDFRKGACRRGDLCEYAHGVFECWLHPAQYRTRLCKDGTSCMRRVCFFAHTSDELRPLYVSTGSAVSSPRSSSAMDMAAALSLLPGSPSHAPMAWPQPNGPTPTLHRLRSSLNARDIPPEDLNMLMDPDFGDLGYFSQPRSGGPSGSNRTCRSNSIMMPSNLDELFSEVSLSPRYSDQASVFSPSRLQQINTRNIEHPLLQASFGVASPGRMSPRSMVDPISPMGSRANGLSPFARDKPQLQQMRSLSARDLGSHNNGGSMVGSPVNSWSKWGSANGKLDWSVHGDEMNGCDEPDLSWVQSLVKESPPEMKDKFAASNSGAVSSGEVSNSVSQIESIDHSVLGAWIEQMQLDQLVA